MEQTRVESPGLKLLCERNEAEKQELENKLQLHNKKYSIYKIIFVQLKI
jgi:hypothetical protein